MRFIMELLMIGGTRFLGRAIVESALARGHAVTLFNRGQSNAGLFPDLEHIQGDRDGDLSALKGRRWDAVIDTCGYIPRHVGAMATLLADAVEHYSFISSISVYSQFAPGMDENGPLGTMADETVEQVTGETYGPLKVLCEKAAEAAMPGRVYHVRAGLIVGRYDLTDRFSYWPLRVARGGQMLAPSDPAYNVQFIDVRDIADFTLTMAERRAAGAYNVTGPASPLTLGEVIATSAAITGASVEPVWADEAFLLENEVQPWTELPLWIPESDTIAGAMNRVNCAKAVGAGLTFRALDDTLRDLLAWAATRPADYQIRAGLSKEKEAAVLAKWRTRD
jgi:2'-hydroxyisoflavone reductase